MSSSPDRARYARPHFCESKLWLVGKTNIPREVVELFPIILLWARPASGAPVMDNIGD